MERQPHRVQPANASTTFASPGPWHRLRQGVRCVLELIGHPAGFIGLNEYPLKSGRDQENPALCRARAESSVNLRQFYRRRVRIVLRSRASVQSMAQPAPLSILSRRKFVALGGVLPVAAIA